MASSAAVTYGTAPVANVLFYAADGSLSDPTTVTFLLRRPDRTVVTTVAPDAAIQNPSVGSWSYQLPALDQEGAWFVRAEGSGAVTAASETKITVRDSEFY